MARPNVRFKRAYNQLIELVSAAGAGGELGSEPALAETLGVSRTTVRAVLDRMRLDGLIQWEGRRKLVARAPMPADRFPDGEVSTPSERLENKFMEWILRQDVPPDTQLRVSALAKRFGVTSVAMQEYLASAARFGLIERERPQRWVIRGFTREYADELFDFRLMIELNAVRVLVTLPPENDIWGTLDALVGEHRQLLADIDARFHDFSELDGRMHAAINGVVANRFSQQFLNVISLIFHYHFQWNKHDERERNAVAIEEHLAYIDALCTRDFAAAEAAARRHLHTARGTLLRSIFPTRR